MGWGGAGWGKQGTSEREIREQAHRGRRPTKHQRTHPGLPGAARAKDQGTYFRNSRCARAGWVEVAGERAPPRQHGGMNGQAPSGRNSCHGPASTTDKFTQPPCATRRPKHTNTREKPYCTIRPRWMAEERAPYITKDTTKRTTRGERPHHFFSASTMSRKPQRRLAAGSREKRKP